MNENPWKIRLFGRLAMERGSRRASPFRTATTGLLLACLVQEERPFRRDELVERLWPEAPPEVGKSRLRQTLTFLRRVLESDPADCGGIVIADRHEVEITPGAYTTDRAIFEEHLLAAGRTSDEAARITHLSAAVDLYQAGYLPEYDEPYIDAERQRLADAYHAALRRLIRAHVNLRQLDTALQFAQRAVAADPYREETHRILMQLHCKLGRPGAAILHYRELEAALMVELGASPARATTELLAKLCDTTGSSRPPNPPARLPIPAPEGTEVPIFRIPKPLTRPIGREDAVIGVLDMLDTPETRLVTLTGMGGIGKTRVALAAAHRLRKEGQQVCFISLAKLEDVHLVPDRIASGLNISPSPPRTIWDQIVETLSALPLILILDNVEQLMPSIGAMVLQLLEEAPELRCLATSRQRLRVAGEVEIVVKPLSVPRRGDTAEQIRACPSVELWADRRGSAARRFAISDAMALEAAALCRRLEGIPLALELAAALGDVLAPTDIIDGLDAQRDLLVNGTATSHGRHASMRMVIGACHERLPVGLRRFAAQLSLFRGGCTAESARAVCDEPNADLYLAQLRDRSLVALDEAAERRMCFLETVREYLSARLRETDDRECRLRFQQYFLRLAEQARAELTGPESAAWMRRLMLEEENIRAALRMMLETPETANSALGLSAALSRYWDMRGCAAEGIRWLTEALRAPSGSPAKRADALMAIGNLALRSGDFAESEAHYLQSLEIRTELEDARGIANTLGAIGHLKMRMGALEEAATVTQRSLAAFQALGDPRGEALTLGNLATIATASRDYASAYRYGLRVIEAFRHWKDPQNLMLSSINLVEPALETGHVEEAARALEESIELCVDLSATRSLIHIFSNAANVARTWDEPAPAIRLRAAATALRARLGITHTAAQTEELDREMLDLRLRIGDAEFARQWEAGFLLDTDAAIHIVRALLDSHPEFRS